MCWSIPSYTNFATTLWSAGQVQYMGTSILNKHSASIFRVEYTTKWIIIPVKMSNVLSFKLTVGFLWNLEQKKWALIPRNIGQISYHTPPSAMWTYKMGVKPPLNYWLVKEFIIDSTAQIIESYPDLKQMKCKLKTPSSYTTLTQILVVAVHPHPL